MVLTIETFEKLVEDMVVHRLPVGYKAIYNEETDHVLFVSDYTNQEIKPSFKVRGLYEMHKIGMSIDDIADEIAQVVLSSVNDNIKDITKGLRDYGSVKNKICGYVVNTKKNAGFLKTCVHKEFLDLSMVFFVFLGDMENNGYRSTTVTNELAAVWNVTVDDLYRDALKNTTEIMGIQCVDLIDRLVDGVTELGLDLRFQRELESIKETQKANNYPANYVLTNRLSCKGAGLVFLSDAVKRYADTIGEDVVIIPSSIHEVILAPASSGITSGDIMAVNSDENCLSKDTVLSDHPYFYIRSVDKIIVDC